jgi:hypothetical protein
MAYGHVKDIKGCHIKLWSSSNSSVDESDDALPYPPLLLLVDYSIAGDTVAGDLGGVLLKGHQT